MTILEGGKSLNVWISLRWIKRSDYPRATGVIIEGNAAEGYIIPVQSAASIRLFDNPRVYLSPIGPDQIKLYKDQGVDLTQNPGW